MLGFNMANSYYIATNISHTQSKCGIIIFYIDGYIALCVLLSLLLFQSF